jgi:hypothetical protein
MATTERAGVASVYMNGTYCEVGANIEIKLGGEVRTAKEKSDGIAGYTTKFVAPEFTLTAIDGPSVSVMAFKAINGQTLQVTLNNGKNYLLYNATQIDDPSIKIADGNVDNLKFSGTSAAELLAKS